MGNPPRSISFQQSMHELDSIVFATEWAVSEVKLEQFAKHLFGEVPAKHDAGSIAKSGSAWRSKVRSMCQSTQSAANKLIFVRLFTRTIPTGKMNGQCTGPR
jgi:hypothetical protein